MQLFNSVCIIYYIHNIIYTMKKTGYGCHFSTFVTLINSTRNLKQKPIRGEDLRVNNIKHTYILLHVILIPHWPWTCCFLDRCRYITFCVYVYENNLILSIKTNKQYFILTYYRNLKKLTLVPVELFKNR